MKNRNHEISIVNLNRYLNVYFDQQYDDDKNISIDISFTNIMFYIKKVFNYRFKFMRFVFRFNSTREKLKISYFDHEYIQNNFVNIYIFLFYLLFINDFDVHKNMYKVLKIFYLILANLIFHKRRKIINVFIFIFELYEIALKNVIDVIAKFIRQLNKNIILNINDDDTNVCVFIFKLINDIFQQTNNSKFLRYNVEKNCRFCFVFKKKQFLILMLSFMINIISKQFNSEQTSNK